MPFYTINEIKKNNPDENSNISIQNIAGEFMKVGVVTKPEGEGVPLHMHPNEEQWTLILHGKMHYILGDEEKIVERGDLIHIPRNTHHRSRAIGGEALFFTVKSPVGSGDLQQDYNKVTGLPSVEAELKYDKTLSKK